MNNNFFQLLKPVEHKDTYNRSVYRVEAATVDPDEILYLHNDGKVKDCLLHLGNPCTTVDFTSIDKAYLAINDYYVAHGQTTPFVRVHGHWQVNGTFNTGQTSAPVVDTDESTPMDFI